MQYNNPYWDELKDYVKTSVFSGRGGREIDIVKIAREEKLDDVNIDTMRSKYSWTITDPDTVRLVTKYCKGKTLDPMSGNGYWPKLLRKHGVTVDATDASPSGSIWHSGKWVSVKKMDAKKAVAQYSCSQTLFLSWPPPQDPVGYETIRHFAGNRVILVGEVATSGNDRMWDELGKWKHVTTHEPVHWPGIKDMVFVYDRK